MRQNNIWQWVRLAALIIGGVLLILFPGGAMATVVKILGIMLVAYGAFAALSYLLGRPENRSPLGLFGGIVSLVLGALALLRPQTVISFFPVAAGVVILAGGLRQIMGALEIRRAAPGSRWTVSLMAGVLSLVLGVVVIVNPFGTLSVVVRLLGIALVYMGISGFFTGRLVA